MGRTYDAKTAPPGTRVLYEGWRLDHCVAADEDAGTAEVAVFNDAGLVQFDEDSRGIRHIRKRTYRGKIAIQFPDNIPW